MYLSVLRYIFKSRSKRGLFDLNKKAEPFFMHLLNIIYSWDLTNLNKIQNNYPAIDLGDKKNGVCIQVTAENGSTKFKKSIKKFIKNKYYLDYQRLVFFTLTDKKNYSTEFETKGNFYFDSENDILDVDDILAVIEELNLDALNEIHSFLSKELSSIIKLFAEKNSLLSQIEEFTGTPPSHSEMFFKFLELEPEDINNAIEEIQTLYKKLLMLSKRSREYLYILIDRGKILDTAGTLCLYVLPADIENYSGLTRSESNEEFQILESNDLAFLEDEDYPVRIEVYSNMEIGTDIFVMLKEFFNDSEKLKSVIIDCDFSLLNG